MNNTYQYTLRLNDKMSSTMKKVGLIGSKTYNKLHRHQETLRKSNVGLGRSFGRLAGMAGIGLAVKGMIGLGGEMETTKVSFGTMLKSVEQGNALFKEMNQFANVTPFKNKEVIKSTRVLLGANIAAKDMTNTMKMVGDVAAGANVPLNDMAAIYAKAMNKGKVQAEELNQMAERGVPILATFAKMYGVTKAEVMEMGSRGELTSDKLKEAFKIMTSEGGMFFNMMIKQSKTFDGLMSTFVGKMQFAGGQIGEKLLPKLKKLTLKLINLADWAVLNTDKILKWSKAILYAGGTIWALNKAFKVFRWGSAMVGVFQFSVRRANAKLFVMSKRLGGAGFAAGGYSGMMGLATGATKLLTWSVKGLSKAIYSIPIFGWLLAGVSALVGGFTLLWQKSEKFREVLFGVGAVIKHVFGGIGRFFKGVYINHIKPFFDAIGQAANWMQEKFSGVGEKIRGFFSKIFDGFKNMIKNAFKPLVTLWNKVFKDNKIKVAYEEGAAKGRESWRNSQNKKYHNKTFGHLKGMNGGAGGLGGGLDGGVGGDAGGLIESTGKNITSGGSRATNVSISLGNLVEKIEINSQNIDEGMSEIEEKVSEVFLRLLNSANRVSYG